MKAYPFTVIHQLFAASTGVALGLIFGVGAAVMLYSSGIYNTYS